MTLHPRQRHDLRQWITLFCIVCVHGLVLWLAMTVVTRHKAEPVRFLSLIKIAVQPKPLPEANTPLATRGMIKKPKANSAKIAAPLTAESVSTISDNPVAEFENKTQPSLNLEDLHAQARKNESLRPRSEIEKLSASQKLNLSIEAKIDRALNKVILPECRMALLGKPIIERMQIIQNHNQKKFCRAEM